MVSTETQKIGEVSQFTGGGQAVLGTGVCKDWSVLSEGGCVKNSGGWVDGAGQEACSSG